MKLVISPLAEKQIRKLPKFVQISTVKKIRRFYETRFPLGVKQLSGYKDIYRVRVGDYRIVFRKYPGKTYIVLVAHRKDVYLRLKKLFD